MAPANAEVIQEWADYLPPTGLPPTGPYTFERGRMEKAIGVVCVEMVEESKKRAAASAAASKEAAKKVKKDDVNFLMNELLLPKHEAEAALQEAGGDLTEAMKKVMTS